MSLPLPPSPPPRPDLHPAHGQSSEQLNAVPAGSGARRRPRSPLDLFLSFTWLALQGFGGVVAIVQRELVDRKEWLTQDEFLEDWAVAQVMPGPNVVNLSMMIGGRYFGLRGAMAALAGMLTVPLIIVIALAVLKTSVGDHPGVAGAFRGMAAASAGMIAASGLRLASALRRNPLPLPWCAAIGAVVFVLVALLRIPLILVLPIVGGLACMLCYRRMAA